MNMAPILRMHIHNYATTLTFLLKILTILLSFLFGRHWCEIHMDFFATCFATHDTLIFYFIFPLIREYKRFV